MDTSGRIGCLARLLPVAHLELVLVAPKSRGVHNVARDKRGRSRMMLCKFSSADLCRNRRRDPVACSAGSSWLWRARLVHVLFAERNATHRLSSSVICRSAAQDDLARFRFGLQCCHFAELNRLTAEDRQSAFHHNTMRSRGRVDGRESLICVHIGAGT